VQALDTGRGELLYEHVLGHQHHYHLVCLDCGGNTEFHDDRIEELQLEACRKRGFQLVSHEHRLQGYCKACSRRRGKRVEAALES
jgi:Fur family ferric uptake transcriptional regulator